VAQNEFEFAFVRRIFFPIFFKLRRLDCCPLLNVRLEPAAIGREEAATEMVDRS
jgi:hypothetical protein